MSKLVFLVFRCLCKLKYRKLQIEAVINQLFMSIGHSKSTVNVKNNFCCCICWMNGVVITILALKIVYWLVLNIFFLIKLFFVPKKRRSHNIRVSWFSHITLHIWYGAHFCSDFERILRPGHSLNQKMVL